MWRGGALCDCACTVCVVFVCENKKGVFCSFVSIFVFVHQPCVFRGRRRSHCFAWCGGIGISSIFLKGLVLYDKLSCNSNSYSRLCKQKYSMPRTFNIINSTVDKHCYRITHTPSVGQNNTDYNHTVLQQYYNNLLSHPKHHFTPPPHPHPPHTQPAKKKKKKTHFPMKSHGRHRLPRTQHGRRPHHELVIASTVDIAVRGGVKLVHELSQLRRVHFPRGG